MTIQGEFGFTYFKIKVNTSAEFKEWKTLTETQTTKKMKKLKTDNGLELGGNEFNKFCIENGIARHHTVRLTNQ